MVAIATYTDEEALRAESLRDEGYCWKVVARKMGRGDNEYWRNAVRRYRERCSRDPLVCAYKAGFQARKAGAPKDPPHEQMTGPWAHWLAGWNDWDMRIN